MPVIQRYHLGHYAPTLDHHIHHILTTLDPIDFYTSITHTIRLLKLISVTVRVQRNKFGSESLPWVMLVSILNFLPPKTASLCQGVCRYWKEALTTPMAQHLLVPSQVIGAIYQRSWDFKHKPRSMALTGTNLVICEPTSSMLEFWDLEGHLLHKMEVGEDVHKITANEKFVCLNQDCKISLLSLGTQEGDDQRIQEWEVPFCSGLALYNDCVYVSDRTSISAYNFKGELVFQFSLKAPESELARRIAIFEDEIFLVDHRHFLLQVYSLEGKLLREWGTRGKRPGEFRDPWGLAVSNHLVYIVDAGNNRIEAFTLNGKFVFEVSPPRDRIRRDLADIAVIDGALYVSDWTGSVLVFHLTYS